MYRKAVKKEKGKKKEIGIAVISAMLLLFELTGCTKKEEITLVQQTENTQETENIQETENTQGIENTQETEQPASGQEMTERLEQLEQMQETADTKIYVHICGAVRNPDVYELEAGSRIYEAIQAAGGFKEEADKDYVNQAKQLSDGEKIIIPTKEETEAAKEAGILSDLWAQQTDAQNMADTQSGADPQSAADLQRISDSSVSSGKVNLNTATKSELCTISGIGEGRAAAIIKYREQNGGFRTIEEIMQVSGIKEATFEKIKDSITV